MSDSQNNSVDTKQALAVSLISLFDDKLTNAEKLDSLTNVQALMDNQNDVFELCSGLNFLGNAYDRYKGKNPDFAHALAFAFTHEAFRANNADPAIATQLVNKTQLKECENYIDSALKLNGWE